MTHIYRMFILLTLLSTRALAQDVPLTTPGVLNPASPNAREVAGLFYWVVGFSIVVLVVVVLFLGAGIIRGLRDRNMDEEPPQTHGNLALEITWTVIPLGILGVLLVLTIGSIYRLDGLAAPEESLNIDVIGKRFWWEMVYPDKGVVTANELVVPVGRPVKIILTSEDVMHSFWVPQLAGKTDLIPGNKRTQWFTAEKKGIYFGQCAEICGDSHANMRLRVVALEPDEFNAWVEAAKQPAQNAAAPSEQLAAQGRELFERKACAGCHAVRGVNTYNRVGPDLSHVGSRTSIAAGVLANNHDNLVRWLRYTDRVKPGVYMPNLGLDEDEANALAAYLQGLTLPGVDVRAMLRGEEQAVNRPDEYGYPVDDAGNPVPADYLADYLADYEAQYEETR